MTNEEAIKLIEEFMVIDDWSLVYLPDLPDALELAIKALKRPKVTYICKDKGNDYCHHTSYVNMARNFEKVGDNAYEEIER